MFLEGYSDNHLDHKTAVTMTITTDKKLFWFILENSLNLLNFQTFKEPGKVIYTLKKHLKG